MANFWIIGLIAFAIAMIVNAIIIDKNTENEKAMLTKFLEDSGGKDITIERVVKWNNQKFKQFNVQYRDSENKWRKAEVLCEYSTWGRSVDRFYWPIPNQKIFSNTGFDLKKFNDDQILPRSSNSSHLSSKEQIINDLMIENKKLVDENSALKRKLS